MGLLLNDVSWDTDTLSLSLPTCSQDVSCHPESGQTADHCSSPPSGHKLREVREDNRDWPAHPTEEKNHNLPLSFIIWNPVSFVKTDSFWRHISKSYTGWSYAGTSCVFPPLSRLCFHPCLFFLLYFFCMQHYTKTSEWISMKLGERMWYGSEKNPVHFRADQDPGADPGILFSTFFNIADFLGNNSWIFMKRNQAHLVNWYEWVLFSAAWLNLKGLLGRAEVCAVLSVIVGYLFDLWCLFFIQ